DKIWEIAVEYLFKRIAHDRMIAAEREHPPAAQQIEVLAPFAIVQILALAALIGPVESDRFQYTNHLFVQMAGVQHVAVRFRLSEEVVDLQTHAPLREPLKSMMVTARRRRVMPRKPLRGRIPTPNHPQGFPESPHFAWFFSTLRR